MLRPFFIQSVVLTQIIAMCLIISGHQLSSESVFGLICWELHILIWVYTLHGMLSDTVCIQCCVLQWFFVPWPQWFHSDWLQCISLPAAPSIPSDIGNETARVQGERVKMWPAINLAWPNTHTHTYTGVIIQLVAAPLICILWLLWWTWVMSSFIDWCSINQGERERQANLSEHSYWNISCIWLW